MKQISQLIARVFIGQLFLLSGISKMQGYEGMQGYMNAMSVPGELLPLVIILEVGGGLAVIAGWQVRRVSIALGLFTLVAAAVFHNDFADQMQLIMFMKNIAVAGGLMLLAAHGAGVYSLDQRRSAVYASS
ncbi:DoxX family protein [Nitrosomonas aestuarii]|uniref:DoxX family protein n=1 Tax=Nitrosomonas aestuarii TaxID=52441 RepID=UPI000D30EB1B|nr:DoxX family protein [Nitrosomonas aestuarii]PTN11993.1 putative oxidoreductase [Nitrosomonas aestuarii]